MDVDGDDTVEDNPHQDVADCLASRIADGDGEVSRQSVEEFVHVRTFRVLYDCMLISCHSFYDQHCLYSWRFKPFEGMRQLLNARASSDSKLI